MAKISSYPLITPKASDLIVVTQTYDPNAVNPVLGNPTKSATLGSVADLIDSSSKISSIGLRFTWSLNDPLYRVASAHIGSDGAYSKLGVDFDNLVLNSGSTYKLLIERNKRPGIKGALPDLFTRYRKGGYKSPNTTQILPAPYTDRLSEIPITAVTGQLFDFRFDLFFRAGGDHFPTPAGFSLKISSNGSSTSNVSKKQHIALRVQETTNGVVTTSSILGELSLVGSYSQHLAESEIRRVTFRYK